MTTTSGVPLPAARGGGGMLAIGFSLEANVPADFNAWYEREHVPERLAIAGFVGARRYRLGAQPSSPNSPGYLTLYEVSDPAVFTSEEYAEALAAPTDWTRQMTRHLAGRTRAFYEIALAYGSGVGGDMVALSFRTPSAGAPLLAERFAATIAPAVTGHPEIVRLCLLRLLPEPGGGDPGEWLAIAEGLDPSAVDHVVGALTSDPAWDSARTSVSHFRLISCAAGAPHPAEADHAR